MAIHIRKKIMEMGAKDIPGVESVDWGSGGILESDDVDHERITRLRDLTKDHAKGFSKAMDILLLALDGEFKSCSSPVIIPEMIRLWLNTYSTDGWIYRENMGKMIPYRVIEAGDEHILVESRSLTQSNNWEMLKGWPGYGTVPNILKSIGFYPDTPELRKAYNESLSKLSTFLEEPHMQCVFTGKSVFELSHFSKNTDEDCTELKNRKVVVETVANNFKDTQIKKSQRITTFDDLMNGTDLLSVPIPAPADSLVPIPLHPILNVFDLVSETEFSAHVDYLTKYEYDKNVKERLILPESHSRIIDILTRPESKKMKSDLIFGKAEGNLILCKGVPGVGKTLTAEVVSEIIERPLYAANLSAIAERDVRRSMETLFNRVRKWDAVLLLDEGDVVLGVRNNDITRNRITGELLRCLEQFERTAFITTNRPDDIDEAFLSRCIAIIDYTVPEGADAIKAWKSLSRLVSNEPMSDEVAAELLDSFGPIAPRDMKQLIRLAYRVGQAEERELTADLIKEVSVFRGFSPKTSTTK